MHILAIPLPQTCHAFGHRSSPLTPGQGWAWKHMGNRGNIPYTTRHMIKKYTANIYTTRVCLGDGNFKPDALKEEGHDLSSITKIEGSIKHIKDLLHSMNDGQISVSPYDTACVAVVRDVEGLPQFPLSIEWIANNQLSDGSWGDSNFFLVYDRLVNTLACVVALKSWNIHVDNVEKGVLFIKENISKLTRANGEYTTCGFELVFPSFLQRARTLGIEGLPYNVPEVGEILAARDRKLGRNRTPTSLVYSLEGLENLEWPKLMKLQGPNGSFFNSPAATSFAVMQTKDENCLRYIQNVVSKFNGGAPTAYPVDILARLRAVDQLERLGIARFFEPEIQACLDHVYRFWSEKGLARARESESPDLDTTSMGFRLLRLHGYHDINPNVLRDFKKSDEFTYYVDKNVETPSAIMNLHRASQLGFPNETLLEEAFKFSSSFLQQNLEKNHLVDQRLISEHLVDEIRQDLKVPWCASLPRVEARSYIQNYGVDDVWIGKSLYRMSEINNTAYLELAKQDYSRCQVQHQLEWNQMQRWYVNYNLDEFGISKRDLFIAYFLASASIFEAERSLERLAWVKSQVISHILVTYYLIKETEPSEHSVEFPISSRQDVPIGQDAKGYQNTPKVLEILLETIRELVMDAQEYINKDISELLHEAWGAWLKKLGEGTDQKLEAELIIRIVNICGGHLVSKETLFCREYKTLSDLTNKICYRLSQFESTNTRSDTTGKEMQLLMQLVLQDSFNGIAKEIKKTFLLIAKTFYYKAYFTTEQIDHDVFKVLVEQVL